jgi:hypothetical protein
MAREILGKLPTKSGVQENFDFGWLDFEWPSAFPPMGKAEGRLSSNWPIMTESTL